MSKKNAGRWLLWVGYITDETEEGHHVEYFGRFCPTKKSVIGILKSMIDNTAPYKILVIDTEAIITDVEEAIQTELKAFITREDVYESD